MEKEIGLLEIFFTFLKINTVTFGGGYTIVPVIRDEFIHKKKLIDEDEMLNIVTLAQSGPGAMAISTSLLTGYRLRGLKGALTALFASILPCLVIITAVFYAYDAFSSNVWVKAALEGMAGVISAALIITVYTMAKQATKKHKIFSLVLMCLAFIVSYFFKQQVHTSIVVVALGLIGYLTFTFFKESEVK